MFLLFILFINVAAWQQHLLGSCCYAKVWTSAVAVLWAYLCNVVSHAPFTYMENIVID